jgi:hypothetical protein
MLCECKRPLRTHWIGGISAAFYLKCVCYLNAKCAPIDRDKYEYLPLLSPTCWQSSIISNGLQTWIANFKSLRREFGTPPKKRRAPAPMKSIRFEP